VSHVTKKQIRRVFYGMTYSFEFLRSLIAFIPRGQRGGGDDEAEKALNARREKAEKDLFTFSMYVLWHRSRWKNAPSEMKKTPTFKSRIET
jgi:hypothetical protein